MRCLLAAQHSTLRPDRISSGGDEGWDDSVISEYTGEGVVAPRRMVRRNRFKYLYTHGYLAQLYNLDTDPLEMENLVDGAI